MATRGRLRIRPVVDLNTMRVIGIEEYGHWPLPPESGNYAASRLQDFRTDIKPLTTLSPKAQPFCLIAPLLYAPNHQHFFSVRLDFDLDGTENTVSSLTSPLIQSMPLINLRTPSL
jgi:Cu2+-containing amine oxidase